VGNAENNGTTLTARLRDISTQGLSFYIDPASEMKLASAQQLKVGIQLPGEKDEVELVANVRYRRLVEELVQFGLAVDWKSIKHGSRVRERIESYIQRRKVEVMERAMGPNWSKSKR
jgi:hypothetical protein